MIATLASAPPVGHYGAAMVTGKQIRAAMQLLGWTNKDLSAASGVHMNTVQRLTNRSEDEGGNAKSWAAIQKAIAEAGVEFLDPGKPLPPGGAGVRLKSGGAGVRRDKGDE